AARHLARADARTATICGCGAQAPLQLAALRHVLDVRRVFAWDIDPAAAHAFAARMAGEIGLVVEPVAGLREATRVSDAIVTCTPARVPFRGLDDVPAGGFVAAVGADNPAKSEIKPDLMAHAIVIVDVLDQAVVMGDLHHAVAAGAMRAEDVHAELGQVIAGTRPGRRDDDAIIVFDSSGTGIQDAAAAAVAYEGARQRGLGVRCSLAGEVGQRCTAGESRTRHARPCAEHPRLRFSRTRSRHIRTKKMTPFDWKFPYHSQRMPVLARNVVATSQPLAAQSGLSMLMKGG